METLSVELYREGPISIGKAAEIAKVSIWEMQEILTQRKIPLIQRILEPILKL